MTGLSILVNHLKSNYSFYDSDEISFCQQKVGKDETEQKGFLVYVLVVLRNTALSL